MNESNEVNTNLNNNGVTPFAATTFRNQHRVFGIKKDDRRRHVYLVGKTGMGKSVTLEHMIYSDIHAGNGLAVVDPHGDLAEKVLTFIPNNRINDVVYFNPGDIEYPVAFNILESVAQDKKHLIASGLIGVFKKIWADSWGPRLEYVLRNTILALLDYDGSTLLGVMRILVDKSYRSMVIQHVTDPVVKSFWLDEYSKYPDKFQIEAIAPIQNKVGRFLSNSLVRNIIGQVKSSINIRQIMDTKKILIMNLSKGHIGEDTAELLGSMMITKIQLAAMERVDVPETSRPDFYLYVDEFQNFATDSFANILSEARKYHLNLIMAHQYIEQLGEIVKPAVFGNVGSMICFRVGATDAIELEPEFMPRFTQEDLVNLAKYEMCLKLMIDGVSSEPFSACTIPPITKDYNTKNTIIQVSRERYTKPRATVEEKIVRWSEGQRTLPSTTNPSPTSKGSSMPSMNDQPEEESNQPLQEIKWYPINCSHCGISTEVPFKPLEGKPAYCKACLKIVKANKTQTPKQKIVSAPDQLPQRAPEQKPFKPVLPKINNINNETIQNRTFRPVTSRQISPSQNATQVNINKPVDIRSTQNNFKLTKITPPQNIIEENTIQPTEQNTPTSRKLPISGNLKPGDVVKIE